jgi:hypothetical protein
MKKGLGEGTNKEFIIFQTDEWMNEWMNERNLLVTNYCKTITTIEFTIRKNKMAAQQLTTYKLQSMTLWYACSHTQEQKFLKKEKHLQQQPKNKRTWI